MKPSSRIYELADEWLSTGIGFYEAKLSGLIQYLDEQWEKDQSKHKEIEHVHESDGMSYLSNPPQSKCKTCGQFYR